MDLDYLILHFHIVPKEIIQRENEYEIDYRSNKYRKLCRKGNGTIIFILQNTATERPQKELKGFERQDFLAPVKVKKFTFQCQQKRACCLYRSKSILHSGTGNLLFPLLEMLQSCGNSWGNSCRRGCHYKKCTNCLQLQESNVDQLRFLSAKSGGKKARHYDNSKKESCSSEAVLENKIAELKAFSIRQLAALCVGYGPGIPFAAFSDTKDPETIFDEQGNPLTVNNHAVGTNGYVSPAIPEKGIHSIFYKDGPAGVGTGAWPTEMADFLFFQ